MTKAVLLTLKVTEGTPTKTIYKGTSDERTITIHGVQISTVEDARRKLSTLFSQGAESITAYSTIAGRDAEALEALRSRFEGVSGISETTLRGETPALVFKPESVLGTSPV